MKNKNKILAIIPARGGSKGIKNKNIKLMNGKPLIYYTIKAALKSKLINRVIVSTDSTVIVKKSKNFGAEVPFLRPKKFSHNTSPAIVVIEHALKYLKDNEGYMPDAIIYLQPTSPLRAEIDITKAITLFNKDKKADSLVSVTEVPHNFHPIKLMSLKNKYLKPYLKNQGFKSLDRHEKRSLIVGRNGPAILIVKTNIILKNKKIYSRIILPYIMPMKDSFDIDDIDDWNIVEYLMKKNG